MVIGYFGNGIPCRRSTPDGSDDSAITSGDGTALIDLAPPVLAQGGEVLPSGRIVVSAQYDDLGGDGKVALISLGSSGDIDNTFGGNSIATIDTSAGFNLSTNSDLSLDRLGHFVVGVARAPEGVGRPEAGVAHLASRRRPRSGLRCAGLAFVGLGADPARGDEAAIDPRSGRILLGGGDLPGTQTYIARFEALPRCGGRVPTVAGGLGRNSLRGTKKADVIAGGAGNDTIRGRGGKDVLCGEAAKDRLLGGKGNDRLLGGKGRDRLLGGPGRDKLKGGPGKDRQKQ